MEKRSTGASPVAVISGIGGVLTAIAALVGLLVTFGVIGGKDSEKSSTTATTTAGAGAGTDGTTHSTTNSTTESPAFDVSPKELTLNVLTTKGNVEITNAGEAPMSVQPASVSGSGEAQFAVKDVSCIGAQIGAGDTCQMAVTFTPGSGTSEARLTLSVKGAPKQTVSLHGKPL